MLFRSRTLIFCTLKCGQKIKDGILFWTTVGGGDECECLAELHLIAAATIDDYVTFRGTYSSGQRNGEGTFFYANGQIYRGAWKDDMRHGKGTLYGPTCEPIYSGSWRADQPAGQTSF